MQNHNQASPVITLKILWAGLLMTNFMYTFALYTITQRNEGGPREVDPMYLPIACSIALLLWGFGVFLPRFLMQTQKQKQESRGIEEMAKAYSVPFILRLAFFEAGALAGFGLAFLKNDLNYFFPFVAITAVAFLMNIPTEEKVKAAFMAGEV
jgi:hypothetical protein